MSRLLSSALLCAALLGVAVAPARAWTQGAGGGEVVLPTTSNPTELKTAIGFGAAYAVVLLTAAWLSDFAGSSGLYVLALVSGLRHAERLAGIAGLSGYLPLAARTAAERSAGSAPGQADSVNSATRGR